MTRTELTIAPEQAKSAFAVAKQVLNHCLDINGEEAAHITIRGIDDNVSSAVTQMLATAHEYARRITLKIIPYAICFPSSNREDFSITRDGPGNSITLTLQCVGDSLPIHLMQQNLYVQAAYTIGIKDPDPDNNRRLCCQAGYEECANTLQSLLMALAKMNGQNEGDILLKKPTVISLPVNTHNAIVENEGRRQLKALATNVDWYRE